MQSIAKATSGIPPAKTRALNGGGAKGVCGMRQGGACRPAPFRARATVADSECVRGPSRQTRRPMENAVSGRERARHQPRSF